MTGYFLFLLSISYEMYEISKYKILETIQPLNIADLSCSFNYFEECISVGSAFGEHVCHVFWTTLILVHMFSNLINKKTKSQFGYKVWLNSE